ncbi:unnamed protein product [Orchesella dallaii]|uniref:serine C-palmitoyltransferase n=1 Tax=Orchesella dallaii TaxID=48710 RepID=A0ABP1PSM6_9HEXA
MKPFDMSCIAVMASPEQRAEWSRVKAARNLEKSKDQHERSGNLKGDEKEQRGDMNGDEKEQRGDLNGDEKEQRGDLNGDEKEEHKQSGDLNGEENEEHVEARRHEQRERGLDTHEGISAWNVICTWFCYLIITIVGVFNDLLRPRPAHYEKNREGYVPLYCGFEGFFMRNAFRLMRDLFGKPIASVPGQYVTLLDRETKDGGLTWNLTGGQSHYINLGSYNYLGFAQNEGACAEAAIQAIRKYGVGTCSARSELGNSSIINELDQLVAKFVGSQAAITFAMGFATNSMNIPAILNERCLVLSDEKNHASIIRGLKLSRATVLKFKHNNMASLEAKLKEATNYGNPMANSNSDWEKIVIVVEGIYSMEGSIVPLPEVIALKKKYNAYLYLDEAHSIGAMGPNGRGVVDYFGCKARDVDVLMGTFSKSFGSAGGYIAGSKQLIALVRRESHAHACGTAMSPPVVAQIITSMRIIMGEDGTRVGIKRIRQLARNTRYFRQKLKQAGFVVYGNDDSPVVPVAIIVPSKIPYFVREMLKRGVATVGVSYPATGLCEGRARFCMSASHTKEMLDHAIGAMCEVGQQKNLADKRMENDNTPTKTIKLEVPYSIPYYDDLKESVAPHGLAKYDYVTPVLAVDVWPTILSYVTEKKDLESVMNTCQLFHDILQPRAFTELILPLLLLKRTIPSESLLACRGINQYTKSFVETTRFTLSPWYLNVIFFHDLDVFIRESLPNLPLNVNPFVCKRAVLHAYSSADLQNFLLLTKNYGSNLNRLFLCVDMTRAVVLESLEMLLQVLNHLPKIQILDLDLKDFRTTPVENEEDLVISPFIFPALNSFSELTMRFCNTPAGIDNSDNISPFIPQFIQNFFQSYGPQLDSFSCDVSMLNVGIPPEFFTSTLPNIKQFEMKFTTPSINTLDTIAQFRFPKLESLILRRCPFSIPFSPALLRILQNFGNSVTDLNYEDREQIDLDQFAIEDLKPLSKITKLTIYWRCNDSTALWLVLHVVLPNLKYLKFQSKDLHDGAVVPGYNRRQAYFNMFPQLEKLIWCIYGEERCFIEKTFTRNIQLPGADRRLIRMGNNNATMKTTDLEKVPLPTHLQDIANSVAAAGIKEYDYFTYVLAVDVWPIILSYITEKKDLESAMNTCQLFQDILQPRAFTELILPLLLLKKTMSHQSVLTCRGINKATNSTVENVLFSVLPYFYPNSLWFENLEDFITEKLPTLPLNVSPFIWKRAVLRASKPTQFPNILILSKNYGTSLNELHLSIEIPSDLNSPLLQVLSNIPQIKNLNLRLIFGDFATGPDNQNEEHQEPAPIFPMLNNLLDLTIDLYQVDQILPLVCYTRTTPLVSQFMQNLIRTYGPQLNSFSCSRALLSMRLPKDFFTSTLANIKKFQVINKPFNVTFNTIAQFKFPKLEYLSFERKYKHEKIPFSPSLLRMLGNFGDTLTELYCEGLEEILMEDQIAVAAGTWKPLLKLTKLTVYWKCFGGDIWAVLQVILPNLRCLKFQPNICSEEAPVPDYNRRQAYFNMFPKLEKLIWCIYGKEMNFIETTFALALSIPNFGFYRKDIDIQNAILGIANHLARKCPIVLIFDDILPTPAANRILTKFSNKDSPKPQLLIILDFSTRHLPKLRSQYETKDAGETLLKFLHILYRKSRCYTFIIWISDPRILQTHSLNVVHPGWRENDVVILATQHITRRYRSLIGARFWNEIPNIVALKRRYDEETITNEVRVFTVIPYFDRERKKSQELDVWLVKQNQFLHNRTLFFDKFKSFYLAPLRVAQYWKVPFLIWGSYANPFMDGLDWRLLQMCRKALNFTYVFQNVHNYGRMDRNGTWVRGMMKLLRNDEVDIGIGGVAMYSELMEAFGFTRSYYTDSFNFISPINEVQEGTLRAILAPFK